MSGGYRCAMCGEEFEGTWSDAEALAEMEEYFGPVPECTPLSVVCDDCFQKIHPAEHPEEVKLAREHLRQN